MNNYCYQKIQKRRVTEVNNSYFECKSINFDINEIKKKLKEVEDKIQKLILRFLN